MSSSTHQHDQFKRDFNKLKMSCRLMCGHRLKRDPEQAKDLLMQVAVSPFDILANTAQDIQLKAEQMGWWSSNSKVPRYRSIQRIHLQPIEKQIQFHKKLVIILVCVVLGFILLSNLIFFYFFFNNTNSTF